MVISPEQDTKRLNYNMVSKNIRGVTRCQECLWYIGNRILKKHRNVCPNCESEIEDDIVIREK